MGYGSRDFVKYEPERIDCFLRQSDFVLRHCHPSETSDRRIQCMSCPQTHVAREARSFFSFRNAIVASVLAVAKAIVESMASFKPQAQNCAFSFYTLPWMTPAKTSIRSILSLIGRRLRTRPAVFWIVLFERERNYWAGPKSSTNQREDRADRSFGGRHPWRSIKRESTGLFFVVEGY